MFSKFFCESKKSLEEKCIFSLVEKTLRKMFKRRKILPVDFRDKGKCIDVLITADEKKNRVQNNVEILLKERPIT